MSHQQPRHAAPDPTPGDEAARRVRALAGSQVTTRATRTLRFWTLPIIVTLAVLSALAALYLGGILKPQNNLRHLPIAVVNEDAGPAGQQIVNGLASGFDKNKFDLRLLSRTATLDQLDTARVYGAVVIPPNFSSKVRDFVHSALSPGRAERPVITILTNPRAGTLGSSIAGQALTTALDVVNSEAGQLLSAQIAQQTGGASQSGAVSLVLASPLHITTAVHNPLPDGTGNGLSAFYYSLLLLLAGFTGSIVVSTVVDSMLGYVPAEFGPVYRFAEQVRISRFRTLLIKWALMMLLALLTSAVYMAIGQGLGMPIQHGWTLWLYGVFAIVAVGVTSTSLIAALGSIGLLASMLLFVILGLPSVGPRFRWRPRRRFLAGWPSSSPCTRCSWAPGRCCIWVAARMLASPRR